MQPRFSHRVCKKCDRLKKFINIWHSREDHPKAGDFRKDREDGSCPLKTEASRSKRESWNIYLCNDIKEEMYNTMNLYYKYTSIPKSSFYKINILTLSINTEEKTFCLYFRLPAIMNLIFRTVRSENLMTSCRDKLYHHTISNKIKSNFLIILFNKMSSRKSLSSFGNESGIERMTDFEKFCL